MQQRILIAIAIGLHPRILIADEPTTGLDPATKLTILDLIKFLNREHGMAVLFITHDVKAVSYVAEHIGIMHNGHLIETGAIENIFTSPETSYMRQTIDALNRMEFSCRMGEN
jgi:ABC-type dipeptide/oligopeptide/nickel transport system ATPase component